MKKLLLISTLILGFAFAGFSQERTFNLPVTFKATSRTEPMIGEKYDPTTNSVHDGTTISFDGKTLKLLLDNGKAFDVKKVVSYRKLELKDNSFPAIVYRLKIMDDGFETFAILSKMFTPDGNFKTLKLPLLSKTGATIGYTNYILITLR